MEPATIKQYVWCTAHDETVHMRDITMGHERWRAWLDPRDPDYEERRHNDDCDEPNDDRTDWEVGMDAARAEDQWMKSRRY